MPDPAIDVGAALTRQAAAMTIYGHSRGAAPMRIVTSALQDAAAHRKKLAAAQKAAARRRAIANAKRRAGKGAPTSVPSARMPELVRLQGVIVTAASLCG